MMFLPSSLGALQVKSEIIVTVNEIPAHGEIRASTARGPPDARGAPIRVGWASPLIWLQFCQARRTIFMPPEAAGSVSMSCEVGENCIKAVDGRSC